MVFHVIDDGSHGWLEVASPSVSAPDRQMASVGVESNVLVSCVR